MNANTLKNQMMSLPQLSEIESEKVSNAELDGYHNNYQHESPLRHGIPEISHAHTTASKKEHQVDIRQNPS